MTTSEVTMPAAGAAGADVDVDRSGLMRTYAEPPVTFASGHGTVLTDTEGNDYLDFISGLAVTSLGHSHPAVARAVAEQAATLTHVSNLYGNTIGPEVAKTIDRLIGGGTEPVGGQVFFCNSGAEANECALKLARRWAGDGRYRVVCAQGSFHGRTMATLAATGQPAKHAPFEPLPTGFDHVPYDDLDAMAAALVRTAGSAAAVLLEPIEGEGGVVTPSSDYLAGVRSLCDEHGALLMLDEVQTGLGRTGHWFAFQALDLRPDVVTMAKALGNGVPVGACWARAEVAAAFGPGDHGSTFGGQPLAMAAARATLEVMEAEDVPHRALAAGDQLARGLLALSGVRAVRGAGLLRAAVLESPCSAAVASAALRRGLLVNAVAPDALRFAPPLLVSADEVDRAVAIVGDALAEVTGPGGGSAAGGSAAGGGAA
jgi:predicted acetylornithine/succinylornithine family transaminase